jgi:hypothetical protein
MQRSSPECALMEPVIETPALETPAGETPALETPALEAPAGETPAGETPAVETPAVETPAGETPAVETPAVETPAGEAALETPAVETPAVLGAWVMKLPVVKDADRHTLLTWGRERYTDFRVCQGEDHCEVGGILKSPPNKDTLKMLQRLLSTNLKNWGIDRRRDKGWLTLVSVANARARLGLDEEARLHREQMAAAVAVATARMAREAVERKRHERERRMAEACKMIAGFERSRLQACFDNFAITVRTRHAEVTAQRCKEAEEVAARRQAKKRKFHVERYGADADKIHGNWCTSAEVDLCDCWAAVNLMRARAEAPHPDGYHNEAECRALYTMQCAERQLAHHLAAVAAAAAAPAPEDHLVFLPQKSATLASFSQL